LLLAAVEKTQDLKLRLAVRKSISMFRLPKEGLPNLCMFQVTQSLVLMRGIQKELNTAQPCCHIVLFQNLHKQKLPRLSNGSTESRGRIERKRLMYQNLRREKTKTH
jgi:hypothetical protein